tara:strand:+ start:521 stop:712 length:192 start_codon:yes stop_codon:yes gene_type:complete
MSKPKIINIEIELDMDLLREDFNNENLVTGNIVKMLVTEINGRGIKVLRTTQLLNKDPSWKGE